MSEVDPARRFLLSALRAEVESCTRCPLSITRNKPTIDDGNVDTSILFIGEAPGMNEDREGRPFCGAAGRQLGKLLASIGLTREQVYVTNVLRCRPPNNREPQPAEIEACRVHLNMELGIIQPKLIVTLGRYSMNLMLPGVVIGAVHGELMFNGLYSILPMYHPAAMLHNPNLRAVTESDFLKITAILASL
jgi:DNA polymerase